MTAALLSNTQHVIRNTFLKFLVVFLLTALYLILTTSPAFAQSTAFPAATTNYELITNNYYSPQPSYAPLPGYIDSQSPTYANKMVYNSIHALSCVASGYSLIGPCIDYQLSKDLQGNIKSVPVLSSVNTTGGLLGAGASLLLGMYNTPPLDARDYIAGLGQDLGIVKEAQAQVGGSGGTVLSPVFALWKVSRNIAYLAMIIVFIVVGLMVMFRQKLNPQTVVSIQMALPGLVIGLVLITFSFFIASTITDVAYLGTDLVGYYFELAGTRDPASGSLSQSTAGENVLTILAPNVNAVGWRDIQLALDQVWHQIINSPSKAAEYIIRVFTGAASYQFGAAVGPTAGFLLGGGGCLGVAAVAAVATFGAGAVAAPACMGPALIGRALGTFVAPSIFALIGFSNPPLVLAIALYFIAIFVLLYTIFKLLFRLITCYLSIIFYTVIGPFSLLVSALPGRQDLAFSWMRNILCNALAFPAVIAVIYFALYFLGSNSIAPTLAVSGTGAVAGGNTLPLFGGMDIGFLRVLVAFGAILATPSIPDIICRAIGKPAQAADILERGIQGTIGAGRKYSDEYGDRIGKVTSDVSSYREKWYKDPYEPTGIGPRLERHIDTSPEASMQGRIYRALNQSPLFREGISHYSRKQRGDLAAAERAQEAQREREIAEAQTRAEAEAARRRAEAGGATPAPLPEEDDEIGGYRGPTRGGRV